MEITLKWHLTMVFSFQGVHCHFSGVSGPPRYASGMLQQPRPIHPVGPSAPVCSQFGRVRPQPNHDADAGHVSTRQVTGCDEKSLLSKSVIITIISFFLYILVYRLVMTRIIVNLLSNYIRYSNNNLLTRLLLEVWLTLLISYYENYI